MEDDHHLGMRYPKGRIVGTLCPDDPAAKRSMRLGSTRQEEVGKRRIFLEDLAYL